jgi:hypothetical protein
MPTKYVYFESINTELIKYILNKGWVELKIDKTGYSLDPLKILQNVLQSWASYKYDFKLSSSVKQAIMEQYIFVFFSYLSETEQLFQVFEIALSNLANGEFFLEAFQEFYGNHQFVEKSEMQERLDEKSADYDYCLFLALKNSLKCLQIILELGKYFS